MMGERLTKAVMMMAVAPILSVLMICLAVLMLFLPMLVLVNPSLIDTKVRKKANE